MLFEDDLDVVIDRVLVMDTERLFDRVLEGLSDRVAEGVADMDIDIVIDGVREELEVSDSEVVPDPVIEDDVVLEGDRERLIEDVSDSEEVILSEELVECVSDGVAVRDLEMLSEMVDERVIEGVSDPDGVTLFETLVE